MKETVLGPCYGSPALANWQEQLAVAWVDGGDFFINVAAGPVPSGSGAADEFAPTTLNIKTAFSSPTGQLAIGDINGRLLLAWVDASSTLQVALALAGTFGAAVQVAADVVGGVCVSVGDRVHIAWRTTADQVMITGSDDGVAIDPPTTLNHHSASDIGIATITHPYHGEMVVLTVDDGRSRILAASSHQLTALNAPGQDTGIGTSGQLSITPTQAPLGSGPGVVLTYRDSDRVAFWNADLDLNLEGGNPHGPDTEYGPASLGWSGDLVVAYVETAITRQLRVGSWASVFGVPADLAAKIGKPCDPRQCQDDPRLVCVLTGHSKITTQDARITNASAGDIILTPADGEGVIGTILKALQPTEFYDHMGLMVEDQTVIRHCTEAKDRVMKDPDYFTGSLIGSPAPTNGLRPDLVKYGWPGPMTQTVQNGFFDGWNDERNPAWEYHGLARARALNQLDSLTEEQRRAFYDTERPEKPVRITNLTFTPTYRSDHPTPLYPLVVRPSRGAEAWLPWVRWALGLVVAEASTTLGHYRFYAYSDATIATDPARYAPPRGDPAWASLPAGADWAAGTPGIVCSTFVWLAATRALADLRPRLFIDRDPLTPHDESARAQHAKVDIDGLFAYAKQERIDAAAGLHDWIVSDVQKTVKQKVDDQWPILGRFGVGALIGMITGLVVGPAAAAELAAMAAAGLSPAELNDIVIALTQMPEHVANGVCNAFADDHPEKSDTGDTGWRDPGPGLSVSPDNIWTFWDAPAENADLRWGLWGSTEQAMLANPRPELVETGTVQLSPGVCQLTGRVTYIGRTMVGAEVFIGCRRATTNVEGMFQLDVPGNDVGQTQLVRAQAYWDTPPGMLIRKLAVNLPPGYLNMGTIELDPPHEWRRRVEMHGELVMIHQVMFGHDTIDHHHWSKSVFVQADPGIIAVDPTGVGVSASTSTFDESSDVCSGEKAHFFGTVRVLDRDLDGLRGVPARPPGATDLSIVVDWTYEIRDGNDQVDHQSGTLVVPPGQVGQLNPALRDGDVPPDRAQSQITVENLVNPA